MRFIGESAAIERLAEIRDALAREVRERYEHRAMPCEACPTAGECCRDEHFVNVRITRLEAAAIIKAINSLTETERNAAVNRAADAVARFGLDGRESATYACPLYDRTKGCLVHHTAKPLPCVHHACYERKDDIPPDELLEAAELAVHRLDRRVYGRAAARLPLPVAISRRSDEVRRSS
jgi:hypothetical protein